MKRIFKPLLALMLALALAFSLSSCSVLNTLFASDGSHEVTFVCAGEESAVSVRAGSVVSPPKTPKRENRIFAGWFTDEECKKEYDFSTPVTRDMRLYADFVSDGAALTNAITLEVMPALVTVENVYRSSPSSETKAQGSGFIYKIEGGRAFVLTNCHVAYATSAFQSITVKDFRGEEYQAQIYRKSPISDPAISAEYDLAILVFPYSGDSLCALSFADADVRIGDEVVSLGSPQNQSHAITFGEVLDFCTVNLVGGSAEESNVTFAVIHHSAAITSGSSGGPVLDADLMVVGVNYAGTKPEEGEIFGMGCAVPLSKVLEFLILYG